MEFSDNFIKKNKKTHKYSTFQQFISLFYRMSILKTLYLRQNTCIMKPGGTYYSLTFQGNISTIKPLHSNVTSDLLVSHNSHPL